VRYFNNSITNQDLVNTTIRNVDSMSLIDVARSLKNTAQTIREKKLKAHNDKQSFVRLLPSLYLIYLNFYSLLGPIMQGVSYLSSAGIGLNFMGMPKHEFGSCTITSIGSIGIEDGYVPIPRKIKLLIKF